MATENKSNNEAKSTGTQYLTYFFIPLPENLGIPNDYFVPIAADHAHRQPSIEFAKVEGVPFEIEYSIVFRQVEHAAGADGLESAFDAARHYVDEIKDNSIKDKMSFDGQTTVAEVMCVVMEHSQVEANRVFEQAVQHINDFINSYYLVEHSPKRLVSLATLPPFVPFVYRTITSKSTTDVSDGELGMYAVNLAKHSIANIKEDPLSKSQLDSLPAALERTQGGLLDVFTNIRREADLAWRDGNTVTAAILLESAAEVLLRETLLFLYWESGVIPREVTQIVETHDLGDILAGLDEKLSGNWSRTKRGAIKSWTVDIALLRDKTVHAGYRPTYDELNIARKSFVQLVAYIADRISANWRRYPLAVTNVVGLDSAKKRLKEETPELEKLLNELLNPTFPSAQFGRWKYEVERNLKGRKAWSTHPDSCKTVMIMYPTGETLWWLVDYDKKLARRAKPPILDTSISKTIDSLHKSIGAISSPRSILLGDVRAKPLSPGSNWYELYKVLPLFEIDRWPRTHTIHAVHQRLK